MPYPLAKTVEILALVPFPMSHPTHRHGCSVVIGRDTRTAQHRGSYPTDGEYVFVGVLVMHREIIAIIVLQPITYLGKFIAIFDTGLPSVEFLTIDGENISLPFRGTPSVQLSSQYISALRANLAKRKLATGVVIRP